MLPNHNYISCSTHCSVQINILILFMQVYSNFKEFLNSLQEGTSKECCFDNHNITTENIVFDTEGDAVAAARHLFVSCWKFYDIY